MTAKDVSGNLPSNPHTGTINVHAGLTNISGTLISAPGMTVANSGQLTLHTQAQDPCGIQTMTAVIDGSQLLTPPRTGTTTADWTIDASQLSVGQHTLVLNAQRNPFAGSSAWLDQRTYTFYVAPTSVTYGGADRSVSTPAELAALKAAVEDEALPDAGYDGLWAGLTPADSSRLAGFLQQDQPDASGWPEASPDAALLGDPVAQDASAKPAPNSMNTLGLGSCFGAGQRGTAPPGAPVPAGNPRAGTHTWTTVKADKIGSTGQVAHKVLVDIEVYSWLRGASRSP